MTTSSIISVLECVSQNLYRHTLLSPLLVYKEASPFSEIIERLTRESSFLFVEICQDTEVENCVWFKIVTSSRIGFCCTTPNTKFLTDAVVEEKT